MAVTVPGFVRKPSLAIWGKKWYILGALGLLLFGGLAAFITQDRGPTPSKTAPKVSSTSSEHRKNETTAVAGAETFNEDEPATDTPASAELAAPAPTTSAPTQQAQSTAPSGPTYSSNNCFNQPPAGWKGLTNTPAITLKAGETSEALEINTLDDSKVIWTAITPDNPAIVLMADTPSGYIGSTYTFTIKANTAADHPYTISWRVEDGSRTICQIQTMTINVEENVQ